MSEMPVANAQEHGLRRREESCDQELCRTVESVLSFEFQAQADDHGRRIDAVLARYLRNYTSWKLHRMVVAGLVVVDELPCEVTQRVFRRQSIRVQLVEPPDKLLVPEALNVPVLYDDPWLMVVDKPAGMVAHPIGEFQSATLCNGIQHVLDQETVAKGILRPGIVHRLDRMTSGLLILAKTTDVHRQLSEMISSGEVQKQYLALVHGWPDFTQITIDRPIGGVPGSSILMTVAEGCRRPRPARTDVRVLKRLRSTSLLQCRLHTGRNHQIRVHLASVGHPVFGDEFYDINNVVRSGQESNRDLNARHALHAAALCFQHPVMGHRLTVRKSPPLDFWTGFVEA